MTKRKSGHIVDTDDEDQEDQEEASTDSIVEELIY